MQIYDDLILNSDAYKKLGGEVFQSYLFCGGDGLALELLAELFIRNKTGKTSSADITKLPLSDAKTGEKKTKILVSDIEYLVDNAQLKPYELQTRFFIINYAETMNDAAANKLLKTLEEPPDNVCIILLSQAANMVLPTIASRCRTVELSAFPVNALNEIIDRHYADSPHREDARALHLGSITRLEGTVNGDYAQKLNLTLEMLTSMKRSGDIAKYSAKIAATKAVGDIVELTEIALHESMINSVLPQNVRLKHRINEINKISAFYLPDTVIRLSGGIERAKKRLQNAGNAQSVTDQFLFTLLEVRGKCQK